MKQFVLLNKHSGSQSNGSLKRIFQNFVDPKLPDDSAVAKGRLPLSPCEGSIKMVAFKSATEILKL